MPTVLIHIQNEDAVIGEIDELPEAANNLILVKNPRRRDGKDLPYLDTNVTTVIWPVHRLNFIEVLPTGEEEKIIGFVRE
jgi:hypothetical protein